VTDTLLLIRRRGEKRGEIGFGKRISTGRRGLVPVKKGCRGKNEALQPGATKNPKSAGNGPGGKKKAESSCVSL